MLAPRHALRSLRNIAALQRHTAARNYNVQVGLLDDLRARGFIADLTRPAQLQAAIEQKPQTVYSGIDPTGSSLHVGHLLPLLCLFHFHIRGHQVIPLLGGATGLIGDPSGRSTERPMSTHETVESNVRQLTTGIERFFDSAAVYAEKRLGRSDTQILPPNVQNNLTWLKDMNLLDFLRVVGFHSRVNTMLARESVQARLSSQQGISFTEFTYQLLQAYDFATLHRTQGCTIQVGGSDQWGNIVAGIELINRMNSGSTDDGAGEKGFGITTPLLTTASGQKFGKSAGNAVSLNPADTSVFDFYQFFLRCTDAEVGRYLKLFTLLPLEHIEGVMLEHNSAPEQRRAQRLLADEVTELVHGEVGVSRARLATKILYERDITSTNAEDIEAALHGNSVLHHRSMAEVADLPLAKLAASVGVVASNSAARQLVSSKGLYLNNKPVLDLQQKLSAEDLIDGRIAILRAGSQKIAVLSVGP